jgi:hypothetical protein
VTKQEYLQELKVHDWTYSYASGDTYYKGEANDKRLRELASQDEELKALRAAYVAFIWNGTEKPKAGTSVKEHAPPTVKAHNLQAIVWNAWKIARKSARRSGGAAAVECVGGAMRKAWAIAKAKALNIPTCTATPTAIFYICTDEKISHNTRQFNQPLIDQAFTRAQEAVEALQVLRDIYIRPFINASQHYHL